jgi:hypothetical protein
MQSAYAPWGMKPARLPRGRRLDQPPSESPHEEPPSVAVMPTQYWIWQAPSTQPQLAPEDVPSEHCSTLRGKKPVQSDAELQAFVGAGLALQYSMAQCFRTQLQLAPAEVPSEHCSTLRGRRPVQSDATPHSSAVDA